jgi:hypothetical protein
LREGDEWTTKLVNPKSNRRPHDNLFHHACRRRSLRRIRAGRHSQFLPTRARPSTPTLQSHHANDGTTLRQQHGGAPFDGSRWILYRAGTSGRKGRECGVGMRDGKLHDQHLGGVGGTPGEHAAVSRQRLWHRPVAVDAAIGAWTLAHSASLRAARASSSAAADQNT